MEQTRTPGIEAGGDASSREPLPLVPGFLGCPGVSDDPLGPVPGTAKSEVATPLCCLGALVTSLRTRDWTFRDRGSPSAVSSLHRSALFLVMATVRLQPLLLGRQAADLSSADSDDFTPRAFDFALVPNAAEVGPATGLLAE